MLRPVLKKKLKSINSEANEIKLKMIQEERSLLQAQLCDYKSHQENSLPLLR